MPVAGPETWDIHSGQTELPYALIQPTTATLDILAANAPRIAGAIKDARGPQSIVIGVGDTLGVTIYETGSGLFVPNDTGVRPGNFLIVPPQAVGIDGTISIPSAGPIQAKGRTIAELEREITGALKNRALEPSVVVTMVDQRSSSYTVLGDVRLGGRFPALFSGERVLDAIGRAGGLSGPGNESWVVIERDGKRASSPFGALIDEPKNNIFVRPRDTIYVFREPQTFLAFGASGRQGQFPFDAWRVSLSEAIAKATGLNDAAANPSAVFVYRGETREVAKLLGVDVTKFEGPMIPVIYNFNLRDPAGYFLTSRFEMRNKDVIYVSNAASVEATKFLNYLRAIMGPINDGITAGVGAYSIKNLAAGTGSSAIAISAAPAPR